MYHLGSTEFSVNTVRYFQLARLLCKKLASSCELWVSQLPSMLLQFQIGNATADYTKYDGDLFISSIASTR